MANRIINPHEIGMHSYACKKGCDYGLKIHWSKPRILDTVENVKSANAVRERIGGMMLEKEPWKIGDSCWFTPNKKERRRD